MIHLPDEDDETIEVFSSPCSAPPIEPVPEVPFYPQETPAQEIPAEDTPAQESADQDIPAAVPDPANEDPVPVPAPELASEAPSLSEEPVPTAASANENVVMLPLPEPENRRKSFEKQAEDSFRMGLAHRSKRRLQPEFGKIDAEQNASAQTRERSECVSALGGNSEAVDGIVSAAGEAYQTVAIAMRSSAEEWMTGFTRINARLFEFGQLNAQNGMDFMRAISGARTVRDAVDAQTAYLRGQYDAMASQLRELQTLTTEVAGKTAQPFTDQFTRAAQLGRMC
jgi:hypothetical protein